MTSLLAQINLFRFGQNLLVDTDWDQPALEQAMATVSAAVAVPAVPPSILIEHSSSAKKVIAQPGINGKNIDWNVVNYLIRQSLGNLNEPDFDLPIEVISVNTDQKQLDTAQQRARKLLDKNLTLSFENSHWKLNDESLIAFISLGNDYHRGKVASYAAYLSSSTDRPARNALFNFDGHSVTTFKAAENGWKLDQSHTITLIIESLKKLETENLADANISLPIGIIPPMVTTADSNAFGISEMVGKGESWFYHSIPSRIHNVDLASSKFHGMLIPPQQVFSFNQNIGDISRQSGYQPAYIIKEGRTVLGDGGGVCQVSTTLFRAALNSGLEIIERTAHAYRVSYYEESSRLGLDATVFDPKPDLVFKNNTTSYLLIQRVFDADKDYLAFEFYGHPDGRQIEISVPRLWDQSPPPPDRYEDDPSLPAGTVKQIDWAAWGAKAAFDYKVTLGGKVLQEKTFYSAYQPWQAVYLRGTKP